MSAAAIGARVMFCGHAGWFVADIFKIGDTCVVSANGRVTPDNLTRTELRTATHRVVDWPAPGYWRADRGVFVVPHEQVIELKPAAPKKLKPLGIAKAQRKAAR